MHPRAFGKARAAAEAPDLHFHDHVDLVCGGGCLPGVRPERAESASRSAPDVRRCRLRGVDLDFTSLSGVAVEQCVKGGAIVGEC
jgi:hypothetical protein